MTGDRLAAIARRLVTSEAFDLVVAPAIADLQFEEGTTPRARAPHYVGIARALASTMCREMRTGVGFVDVGMLVKLVVIQTMYYVGLVMAALLAATPRATRLEDLPVNLSLAQLVTLTVVIILASIVPVAVCFCLELRSPAVAGETASNAS